MSETVPLSSVPAAVPIPQSMNDRGVSAARGATLAATDRLSGLPRWLVASDAASLGSLLPVVAPAASLAVILVWLGAVVVVPDTWVALVSGREIVEHGLPSTEQLTVLARGREWVDQQWLGQVALYGAARIGGVGLAMAVCMLSVIVAFFIAALAAHRRGASPLSVLGFVVLALYAGPWALQARTQALALPLFALVLWLMLRDPDGRRVSTLWLLPILCIWANIHGSVVVGAALVAAYALQTLVRNGRHWRRAALFVGAPAAIFASPYALELPGYYRLMLLDPPFGREIAEWQRTTLAQDTIVFFALLALVGLLLILRRQRVTILDVLLLTITATAALAAVRNTPWFALTALAVVPPLATRRPGAVRFGGPAAALMTSVAVAGIFGAVGWASTRNYDDSAHEAGLTIVRDRKPNEDVFADLDIADWLLWKIPELRGHIAFDGRPELLTHDEFQAVVLFPRQQPGWQSAVHGYSLIVTRPVIAARAVANSRWRRAYTDGTLAIIRSPQDVREGALQVSDDLDLDAYAGR